MINFNPNLPSLSPKIDFQTPSPNGSTQPASDFSDTIRAVGDYISNVDQNQQASEMSITDLMSGKNEDIVSVVAEFAKADMSFKLLVGVRNKLIEAYRQTMNMPL
jgi:flagellar hook-basal body complex protein FliE